MSPSFSDFPLDPLILKALEKMEYRIPSPVQQAAIPAVLAKKDLVILAQTGSGKTAASAIPLCDQVDPTRKDVQALVVVPTRELALQYATETQKIGRERGVKAFAMLGGEDPSLQRSKLQDGVHVLVATPGRLIDFIYSRSIDLSHVATLVLDEADEMLSMGFYEDLDFITQCLTHPHQTLLFSATMPAQIRKLATKQMRNPEEINLTATQQSPSSIEHFFAHCTPRGKEGLLLKIIQQEQPAQAIIFANSRFQVEAIARSLQHHFRDVDFLHAGLQQSVRTVITNKFRKQKIRFLIATDVVARGLDFSHLSHVILHSLPNDADTYIHRVGRTGRQERQGRAISLVCDRDRAVLKEILRRIKQNEATWLFGPPPPEQARSSACSQDRASARPPARRRPPQKNKHAPTD